MRWMPTAPAKPAVETTSEQDLARGPQASVQLKSVDSGSVARERAFIRTPLPDQFNPSLCRLTPVPLPEIMGRIKFLY